MNKTYTVAIALATALSGGSFASAAPAAAVSTPNPESLSDPTGTIQTYSNKGQIDTSGAFFQSLGTNGRTCATCHVAAQAMGISAAGVRARFLTSRGQDPIFAPIDGANCPTDPQGKLASHSLLLASGLIRIPLTLPATAQFTISVVHDPYGCAIVPDVTGQPIVSVYRRPLPTTNLNFLSAVMFDGRETLVPLTTGATFAANIVTDLTDQANKAITIHAQAASPPSSAQLADIVSFELGLFTAQQSDIFAGSLADGGASGGALQLSQQEYYPGINDVLGADPTGAPFNSSSMTLFNSWAGLSYANAGGLADVIRITARRAIAAGETLFNTLPINITNVRGLNDNAALGKPTTFVGHCTTCHDAPNVGDHSLPLPLDIGTGHSTLASVETDPQIEAGLQQLSLPDLPVYLISGCPDPFNPGQPASFYTSDPGKGLITGQCSDLNRVKGPILRGLAARAPYFHNGAAANLLEAVNFYNQRFQMNLTALQKAELVAFLNSL
jgi:cytochrome c peroxidase